MTPFFNIIQPALWKVTRNLMRDYRELENMQLGNCLPVDRFSLMSCQRVRDVIQQEVSLSSYKSMIFNSTKLPEEEGLYLLVQDLEGVQNFKKSLPFFATSVVCIEHTNKLTQAIAAYITLPA
ncbi:MAG: hypothetical protein EB127_17215, partial [Alphaproteobacteria bacterium]|nr:hypothetical protein [Alphaproteobacteria bacterium]